MHGNVSEWVWDYYGSYSPEDAADPSGPSSGTLRVYRGGGWNDFAKNMRSAYRATLPEDKGSFKATPHRTAARQAMPFPPAAPANLLTYTR